MKTFTLILPVFSLLLHTGSFSELLLQSPLMSLLIFHFEVLFFFFFIFHPPVIFLRNIFWNWNYNFNYAEWSVYAPVDQLSIFSILLCDPRTWPWSTASVSLSCPLVSRYAQTVGGTDMRMESKRKEMKKTVLLPTSSLTHLYLAVAAFLYHSCSSEYLLITIPSSGPFKPMNDKGFPLC